MVIFDMGLMQLFIGATQVKLNSLTESASFS